MERKCSSCANCEYRNDGERLVTDACAKCNWVEVGGNKVPSNWKAKPMTNADRIRAMRNRNEIIQALKCCVKDGDLPCEGNCPYSGEDGCVDKVMADALELLEGK